MNIREFYNEAVLVGHEHDPRGTDDIQYILEKTQDSYADMKDVEKEIFDKEKLNNVYSDTRILHENEDNYDIKVIMVGVDIETPELLLAHTLRQSEEIDLVIAHHPEGRAYANLGDVMKMQADIHAKLGVSISAAEDLIAERSKEVRRSLMGYNHMRPVDTAKLLDIPYMCIHTPADNIANHWVNAMMEKEQPKKVSDVVDLLMDIPEYKQGKINGDGPTILCGSGDKTAGKVWVDFTGGTGGPKGIYEKLANSGVNTIVGMHLSDTSRKEANKHNLNVVIAGHYPSDSVGLNLLLKEIMKNTNTDFEVIECSGYIKNI